MKKERWKPGTPLPPVMNAEDIASYLGISVANAYKIMNQSDFPSIRIGVKLLRVPTDKFLEWLSHSTPQRGG